MRYGDLKQTAETNSRKIEQSKNTKKWLVAGMSMIVFAVMGVGWIAKNRGLFDPISVVANVTGSELKETDGRTNILILGSDEREGDSTVSSILTDTIIIASIGKISNDIVLISVPRDLWIESPQGYKTKINALYVNGGADEIKKVVEDLLGMSIHYYAVVGFDVFKEAINIMDGVDVDVEQGFTDVSYPISGKENAPENERYETIYFEKGTQKMDGAAALKFVRSRKGDNNEGTDFARAKRQQKVILAIKTRVLSADTLLNPTKLKNLYDSYVKNVDTNLTFADIQSFYLLSKEINLPTVKSVVLDDRSDANDGGLLYEPTDKSLYGGFYVLLPKTGDYSQIHAYVQRYLFGDK